MRKSKPRKNLPHGECVVPKGWDIETVPRLDRIAAALDVSSTAWITVREHIRRAWRLGMRAGS